MTTPHELLGVPRSATKEQITQAYRRLAQLAHPDKGGDAETFAVLRDAYEKALASEPVPDCNICHGEGEIITGRTDYGDIKKQCECRKKPRQNSARL